MSDQTPRVNETFADTSSFRAAMRHVPTPVAIVATTVGTTPVGLAVGSFASVSLQPALVTFFVDHKSTTWPQMDSSDTFTVNFLGHQHAQRCHAFSARGADRFRGVQWTPSATGDPILADAAVVLQCRKHCSSWLGDHRQIVGEVIDVQLLRADLPLVFHQGSFLNLDNLVNA
jgi:3-hydroxy-9,10-secoandrosta-1,3,5(10)-triene-9,17-dione monooxygenase reductase component